MKICLLIPVYDHPHTIRALVQDLARFDLPCILVDDGSHAETAKVLDELAAQYGFVHLERRARNGGRGAAMQTGYRCARGLGFSHALQLDADGQHSPNDVPAMIEAAHKHPSHMILGAPIFDASAPASRLFGRQISRFWVWLETLGFAIDDPLCGLRLLPLEPACRVLDRGCGQQMAFDTELIVRMYWEGVAVVNVPARVRYFEDGISHFRPVRDNLHLSWLHARLVAQLPLHAPWLLARRMRGGRDASWHERNERGSELGIRIVVWLYCSFGEPVARGLVLLVVAYFFATDRSARRASREYLARVRAVSGTPAERAGFARTRDVFRHFLEFGWSILDRAGFWLGKRERFKVDVEGAAELDRVAEEGRGAIVLGAHLGSFDVLRLLAASDSPILVHVLMYTRHARRINRVFERLDQRSGTSRARVRVLQIEPGAFEHALRAKACVQRGEVIGILADRTHPQEASRSLVVDVLGAPARLPRGPFALARSLDCPVLLMLGVRTGRRRYRVEVTRLPEDRSLARDRSAEIQHLAQQYADWLGGGCARYPLQWFNFHDFWRDPCRDPSR